MNICSVFVVLKSKPNAADVYPMHVVAAWARRGLPFDRLDLILLLSFLIVVGPWVSQITATPASRYALTAAIVEDGTVRIDDYRPILSRSDLIELDGRLYSDKAPVLSLLGVPVLAVAEALGVPDATEHRMVGNIGLWSQTFVFAVLPGALLVLLMRRHARRYVDDRAATVAAVTLGCASMILVFSVNLFSHVFVAFLLLLAWHVVTGDRFSPRSRLLIAGILVALGGGSEYPAFVIAGIIALWVLTRKGVLAATLYSFPTLVAGLGVLAWNNALYGSSATSYEHKGDGGNVGRFINLPKPRHVIDILSGDRGLIFTPIVLLGIVGLGVALYERRQDIVVPAAAFGFVFLLQAGWGNPWGGLGPGPRYILIGLPFLAYPLATIIPRVSRAFVTVLAAIGAVSMGLAAITLQWIPDGSSLIVGHIGQIRSVGINPTIFTLGLGDIGWVLHAALAAFALRAVVSTWREQFGTQRAAPRSQPSPALSL